ncbi:MAG: glycosyltransferase family 39 protein [Chloroflexota bacterium]|nr:glycosyltransferase family 39 protein [Chloroflexota bacterium]
MIVSIVISWVLLGVRTWYDDGVGDMEWFMTTTRSEKLLVILFSLCFALVVTRNAWLSDDAYITFRTVDNFINGYGLTWNVVERVQAYTHPLWMLLFSAVYFFTREAFFSSQLLSIFVSLLAVFVLLTRVANSSTAALLGITILTMSKAFVDYSTSGLENPLTHLLLAVFLFVYIRSENSPRTLFSLSLLAALGMLNRMDAVLLFLPPLVYALVTLRQVKWLYAVAAGFIPVILWELFSLFYYGALFPNTAFAKLNLGLIGRQELIPHGLYYLFNSIKVDPLTLIVIGAAIGLPFVTRTWRSLPVVIGFALYLLYVVSIGGDFMSGRFMTAPLLCAVAVLVSSPFCLRKVNCLALCVPALVLGLSAPYSPVLTVPEHRADFDPGSWVSSRGISDEGANYYRNTGLLMALRRADLPDHDWALEGRQARLEAPPVVQRGSVGFFGYFAGHQVYVVDLLGLADPLLARLPPTDPNWRVGHFGRTVPDGYMETLVAGDNRVEDKNLAAYYDRLMFVIRGDLFDFDRLVEVWRLNTGAYDHYLDAYAYARGGTFTQPLQVTNPTDSPYAYAYVWNNGAAEAFLLDDASQKGSAYTIKWDITMDGIQFEGPYKRHVSSINVLSDSETLNVGVYFSDGLDVTPYNMFERRFWFSAEDDGQFVVVLPGAEWHNPRAPQGAWLPEDIDEVMRDAPVFSTVSREFAVRE